MRGAQAMKRQCSTKRTSSDPGHQTIGHTARRSLRHSVFCIVGIQHALRIAYEQRPSTRPSVRRCHGSLKFMTSAPRDGGIVEQ